MVNTEPTLCAICGNATTVTNWRPTAAWLAVEGCPCGDFFVWAPLWEGRLSLLPAAERQELARRIRSVRTRGIEVWLMAVSADINGMLVISPERPAQ
jgi:hypothetical protein